MKIYLKNRLSITLKILTVISSLGGLIISLTTATFDGYSHWTRRLAYFTAQSNIWIGITFLAVLFAKNSNAKIKNALYLM
jgi:hypothetical protein